MAVKESRVSHRSGKFLQFLDSFGYQAIGDTFDGSTLANGVKVTETAEIKARMYKTEMSHDSPSSQQKRNNNGL